MIIIWGRKIQTKFVGRKPGYCPLCRMLRPFRVEEVVSVGHLYYIPLGSRRTEAVVRVCEQCRQKYDADDHDYSMCVRDRRASLEELLESAPAGLGPRDAVRLEMEERVRAKRLTPEERRALVGEPFHLVASDVEVRRSTNHIDTVSGTLLALTAALTIGWIILAGTPPVSGWFTSDQSIMIGLGIFAVTGISMLIAMMGDTRRYCRRVALPKLARALQPLDPSDAEIEAALDRCRGADLALARYLRPTDVREALDMHLPDSV